jgi:hypothetical protein
MAGRLGGRRDRPVPARQRRPGPGPLAWSRPQPPGRPHLPPAAPRPPRPPARRHRPPAAVGDVGPCLAMARADLHAVLGEGWRSSWAGPSGPWHTWTGRSRSASTTAAAASTTWSSGPTGSTRRCGGWPWTTTPVPVGQHSWRFLAPAHPAQDRDGHARPGRLLPDRPGRPGAGRRLCRRDRRQGPGRRGRCRPDRGPAPAVRRLRRPGPSAAGAPPGPQPGPRRPDRAGRRRRVGRGRWS